MRPDRSAASSHSSKHQGVGSESKTSLSLPGNATLRLTNGRTLEVHVGKYFTPNGHGLGGGASPGPGITPNLHAPDHPPDEAIDAADRAKAAGGA